MNVIRNKRRVLIVNENLRRAEEQPSADAMQRDYRIVGIYGNLKHAYFSLPKTKPEILVVAITQNNTSALPWLKKFRQQLPSLKILVQSDISKESAIMDIVTVGICGIIPLEQPWSELKKTIDDIESGIYHVSHVTAKILLELLQVNVGTDLTPRQIEILKLMSLGKTNTTIADKLQISPETAKTHVKNIYRRLNVKSKEEALSLAVEEKLILFF